MTQVCDDASQRLFKIPHFLDVQENKEKVCVIDMGSNKFKLILGDKDGRKVQSRILRKVQLKLGNEVIKHRHITPEKMEEVRLVLIEFWEEAKKYGCEHMISFATSAIRSTENKNDIFQLMENLNIPIEILTAQREAEIGYLAGNVSMISQLVCELGSHSIQIVWESEKGRNICCIPLGYQSAYRYFVQNVSHFSDSHQNLLKCFKEYIDFLPNSIPIISALSAKSLASFVLQEDITTVGDGTLSHVQIIKKIDQLKALSVEQFKKIKKEEPKINKIITGLVLLDYLMTLAEIPNVFITSAELGDGYLMEYFSKEISGLI